LEQVIDMSDQHDLTTDFEPEYPTNTVIGVFEEPLGARQAVSALEDVSIDSESVDIVCNQIAEDRLEEVEEESMLKAKIVQFLFAAGEESEELNEYDRLLDEGRYLVRVPVEEDEQAKTVAEILQRHGGHYINYFSKFTVTKMVS
jgi:hypothetical protein